MCDSSYEKRAEPLSAVYYRNSRGGRDINVGSRLGLRISETGLGSVHHAFAFL